MSKSRILIADDEKHTCQYIEKHIKMEPNINALMEEVYRNCMTVRNVAVCR